MVHAQSSPFVEVDRCSDVQVDVVLANDQTLVREGLASLLRSHNRFRVVGEAAGRAALDEVVRRSSPQVVLLDDSHLQNGAGSDGPSAAVGSKGGAKGGTSDSRVSTVFLCRSAKDHTIAAALRAGAKGVVLESDSSEVLAAALAAVAQGESYFSEDVRRRLTHNGRAWQLTESNGLQCLTARETEVLCYIARGLTKRQIAAELGISRKTVDGHSYNLMKKLDVHDRVELTRLAIREQLIEL